MQQKQEKHKDRKRYLASEHVMGKPRGDVSDPELTYHLSTDHLTLISITNALVH